MNAKKQPFTAADIAPLLRFVNGGVSEIQSSGGKHRDEKLSISLMRLDAIDVAHIAVKSPHLGDYGVGKFVAHFVLTIGWSNEVDTDLFGLDD